MKGSSSHPPEILKVCCRALDAKKAENLRVLDVSAQSSITDYLVLATGTSQPHLRALRVELEKAVDAARTHIVGIESSQDSGWMVVDLFNVMVHLFTADTRAHYSLENLWKDATEVSTAKLIAAPKAKAKARKPAAAKKPRKRAT